MDLVNIGKIFLIHAHTELQDFRNDEVKKSFIVLLELCITEGYITYEELEKYWLSFSNSNQILVYDFINEIKEWEALRKQINQ